MKRRGAGAQGRSMSDQGASSAPLRPRAPASGSTLIEMIVVLAIVALLFGVAVPALTTIPTTSRAQALHDSLFAVAITSGQLVRAALPDTAGQITALPDGRTIDTRHPDAR